MINSGKSFKLLPTLKFSIQKICMAIMIKTIKVKIMIIMIKTIKVMIDLNHES